jgi:peptidoglycan hydrolase-like protein with peptidoglycan-binding domain
LAQTASASYEFNQNLTIGSTGADVIALQQLLINKGFLTSVSAPTGYFRSGTQAALGKFQAANGISPASGYFGSKSRAFVNSLNAPSATMNTSQSAPSSNSQVSIPPPSGTLCNGSYYTACPTGQDFVCPASGGAYCQLSPRQTNPQVVQQQSTQVQENTALETDNKNKAIVVLNQIITDYTSLDTYLTSAISAMNSINTNLSLGNKPLATLIINVVNARLKEFGDGKSLDEQILNMTQTKLSYLESQPLSYFLNYSISTDPDNLYAALSKYSNIELGFENKYSQLSSDLNQDSVSGPIAFPYIAQPIH